MDSPQDGPADRKQITDLGGLGGSGGPPTAPNRWGASPPTWFKVNFGRRDRPDRNNQRNGNPLDAVFWRRFLPGRKWPSARWKYILCAGKRHDHQRQLKRHQNFGHLSRSIHNCHGWHADRRHMECLNNWCWLRICICNFNINPSFNMCH